MTKGARNGNSNRSMPSEGSTSINHSGGGLAFLVELRLLLLVYWRVRDRLRSLPSIEFRLFLLSALGVKSCSSTNLFLSLILLFF